MCDRFRRVGMAMLGCALAWSGGCRERDDEPEVMILEGVITQIDPDSRRVMVRFHSEKRREDRTVGVYVTPESEIMIDGAIVPLSGVKEGERALGTVRVEKQGDETLYTALRVEITRSKPLPPLARDAGSGGS